MNKEHAGRVRRRTLAITPVSPCESDEAFLVTPQRPPPLSLDERWAAFEAQYGPTTVVRPSDRS